MAEFEQVEVPYRPIPGRGKHVPLSALESLLDDAKAGIWEAKNIVRFARNRVVDAEALLAERARDLRDIERAIEAVRNLPTEPLADYKKAAAKEVIP